MTWLVKPLLLRIFVGVAAAWLLTLPVAIPTAHANNWGEIAIVAESMGVSDSRICIGDGTRGDIGCPGFAPTISPTGRINATAGLTVDSVSLTTTGTTWGYLGGGASYVPNLSSNAISASTISATTISTTLVQIASTTTVTTCNTGSMGSLRYNRTSASLELCDGTSWQSLSAGGGVGVPTGTIAAFASSTCPTGWNEYTAARGRFLRGIDNEAGNDPSGTRAPGNIQNDEIKSHNHSFTIVAASSGSNALTALAARTPNSYGVYTGSTAAVGGAETRPKNVAVIFCEYSGAGGTGGGSTSSTVVATDPAGSTGQIQYNTSGSFDASANLTWDNANSRLTATNVSAEQVSATGMSSQMVTLTSPTTVPECTPASVGAMIWMNGRTYQCRP